MFISKAYAQTVQTIAETAGAGVIPPEAPDTGEFFMRNVMFVAVMVTLFYVLLIRPQQKRFKEHSQTLQGLKKGDRVVTGGGLIGVIDTIEKDSDEVLVDLGGGLKVTALRDTLQGKTEVLLKKKPANDPKAKKPEKKKPEKTPKA